jgi:hypothetical protein
LGWNHKIADTTKQLGLLTHDQQSSHAQTSWLCTS